MSMTSKIFLAISVVFLCKFLQRIFRYIFKKIIGYSFENFFDKSSSLLCYICSSNFIKDFLLPIIFGIPQAFFYCFSSPLSNFFFSVVLDIFFNLPISATFLRILSVMASVINSAMLQLISFQISAKISSEIRLGFAQQFLWAYFL